MARRKFVAHRMNITLTHAQIAALQKAADARQVPMAAIIRWALDEYIASHAPDGTRTERERIPA